MVEPVPDLHLHPGLRWLSTPVSQVPPEGTLASAAAQPGSASKPVHPAGTVSASPRATNYAHERAQLRRGQAKDGISLDREIPSWLKLM